MKLLEQRDGQAQDQGSLLREKDPFNGENVAERIRMRLEARWATSEQRIAARFRMEALWKDPLWRKIAIRTGPPSVETRQIIGKALEKSFGEFNREYVDKVSLPLLLRGATNQEVIDIIAMPALDINAVDTLKARFKRQGIAIPNMRAEKMKRVAKARKNSSFFSHEGRFALEMVRNGTITKDTSPKDRLVALFAKKKEPFPASFAQQLQAEVYMQAVERAEAGDRRLLNMYKKTGESIDREWFGGEFQGQKHIEERVTRSRRVDEVTRIYGDDLFTKAFWRLARHNTDVANDIVQDAFENMLTATTFICPDDPEEARAYLFVILKNAARDYFRKMQNSKRDQRKTIPFSQLSSDVADEGTMEETVISYIIFNEIAHVAPIAAMQTQGYTLKEISAAQGGVNVNTLKTRNMRQKESARERAIAELTAKT